MIDIALSLTVLATIALLGGALVLFARGDRRRAFLMAVVAAVAAANVAIWSIPAPPPQEQQP